MSDSQADYKYPAVARRRKTRPDAIADGESASLYPRPLNRYRVTTQLVQPAESDLPTVLDVVIEAPANISVNVILEQTS